MLKLLSYLFSSSLARASLPRSNLVRTYLLLILCSPSLVFAKSMADEITVKSNVQTVFENRTFVPIGETTFSILFWDLYKSNLLTTSGKYPIEIEKDSILFNINYLTDISSEDLLNRTVEQWQHLGLAPEDYEMYLSELGDIWPDIKDGDSLSLLVVEGKSVFYFNQEYVGAINDQNFGQMFIDIWLSENTSQPDLRRELLEPKQTEHTLAGSTTHE